MELRDGIFAVKLCELERQYGLLQTRLELCQGAGHEKIRDNALLMERRAEGSRSPAVAELSSAQRDYDRRVEEILREKLPRLMRGEEDPQEEHAEAAALYAEYAIDFASQAMRGALLAALIAIDQQMSCEEQKYEGKEEYR